MKEKGIRIIGISDSIASRSRLLFSVLHGPKVHIYDRALVMSLIHSILYGVWMRDRKRYRNRIEARKRLFVDEKVFVSENIPLPDLMP